MKTGVIAGWIVVLITAGMVTPATAVDLYVVSPYGGCYPPVGTNTYPSPTNLTCSVTNSPIALGASTQLVCTGWTGTGDVPASGTTASTGPIGLTNDSTIAWNWATQVQLTVTTLRGGGTYTSGTGWYTLETTNTVTANPDEYCSFVGWSGETNGCIISGNEIAVPIDGPRTLTAEFTGGPWAYEVVEHVAGTNAQAGYDEPTAALGRPQRVTGEGTWPSDVSPFSASWLPTETCSVGSGGRLVLAFDHPVSNDVLNPYGIDLLVFGNAFFMASDYSPRADMLLGEPGAILVSQDGTNWFEVPHVKADHLFPTMGFTDTSTTTTYGYDGTTPTDFLKPVDSGLNWTNMTFAELQPAYDGSGGGTPVDIGTVGLEWIRYVMITQALGQGWSTEIDAISDVAPVAEFMLTVATEGRGHVDLPSGAYAHGTNLALTATPGTYFHFSEWTGDVQGGTTTNILNVPMDRDRAVTAVFDPDMADRGTPVYWLAENVLTNATYPTFDAAANADIDTDGFDAWQEFLAGTDANDVDSYFQIIDLGWSGASNYVTWIGGTNGSALPFQVRCTDNVTNEWTVVNGTVERDPSGTNTVWYESTNDFEFIQIHVER